MRNAVVVEVVRTAVGKGKMGGALSGMHPVDLLATVLEAIVERNNLDPAKVDDVITGCVSQVGEQALNIGRHGLLAAGFPESVPSTTLDRQCGSSQQAVHFAAQGIMAGAYDIVIAAGVESMSRIPLGKSSMGENVHGERLAARYPEGLINQGVSAELISEKWGLTREELDEYSARSHRLAAEAVEKGYFDNEIIPIEVTDAEGNTRTHTVDETIRPTTTVEGLGGLKASFATDEMRERFPDIDWKITPGNSSPLTDGASAALIMEESVAEALGLKPRARFVSFSVVGSDPMLMLTGPIPATQQALERAGLTIDDIDRFEVNEAFAPVPLAWAKELGADLEKTNVVGGAIALGHALGSSGTRLFATLVNELERSGGRYGLQTMCEGAGMANATIIERI
ncbi:thiolase family protein [Corynebacterium sp. TA-R-1]|uniref:Thiolase family protein n=1 Tax=Corynebacterium stercoris TaxID=2943490 RepID=A0ABT1G3Q8_9CORY|nr:thiolase family protein [Corynebacterium stercoris]MCP1388664.1 thiolase family protein [Corynebacterium stercoris]